MGLPDEIDVFARLYTRLYTRLYARRLKPL